MEIHDPQFRIYKKSLIFIIVNLKKIDRNIAKKARELHVHPGRFYMLLTELQNDGILKIDRERGDGCLTMTLTKRGILVRNTLQQVNHYMLQNEEDLKEIL